MSDERMHTNDDGLNAPIDISLHPLSDAYMPATYQGSRSYRCYRSFSIS
jgi:hypothetical protein